MRNVTRGFLALSVLLWLMAAPSGTAAPQQGQLSPNDGTVDSGVPCGQEPDDADQVAAVRALADEQCDCDSATNHGKYVNCVAKVAEEAVAEGELREECQDTVVSCAAQSTCGVEGAVTCCRTDATGNTTCSIKRTAAACKAPSGGSAFVGSTPSCCDACGAPGSTTTTTTTPAATTTTGAATTTTTGGATTTTTTPAQTQCCVQSSATGAFDTCMLLTPAECSAQGGQDAGPGSCSPNPCPPGATTTTAPVETTTTTAPVETTTTTAPAETTTTTAPVETTTTTAPAETTTTEAVTTTTELPTTTTTAPGSPSGAFLDRPEALR